MADEDYPIPVIEDMRVPPSQNHFVGANSSREFWALPAPPPPQNSLRLSQPRLQPQPQQQQKRQQQIPPSQNSAAKTSPRRRKSRPTNTARQFQQELERQEREFALQMKNASAQVEKDVYFREEKEGRRIRNEEMHQGLVNFNGEQRGWNGERESDGQPTLKPYREQENITLKPQGKSLQPSTEEQRKPKPKLTKKQQEKANKILEDEMRAATMAVLNQREINNIFFDDYVKQKQEETHKYLTSRKWDLDAIKAEARADFKARAQGMPISKPLHARGRRKSSSVEQHEEGSPLESGSSQDSDTQKRRLSTAERRGSATEQQIYGGRKTRSSEAERLAQDGILGIGSSSPVMSRRQSKKPKFYGQADAEDLN